MRIVLIALLILAWHSSVLAQNDCVDEKKAADHWNRILKYKVTEVAREKHRKFKRVFLECLRVTKSAKTNILQKIKKSPKNAIKKINQSHRSTRDVIVSDYTKFKGKKKRTWHTFFTESSQCMKNRNNMQLFVQCAATRKKLLKEFNARWDNQSQTLRSLLTQK